MMGVRKESIFFILLCVLIVVVLAWSITNQLREADPEIEMKYKTAASDLSSIKAAIIRYYCNNKRFPLTLKELVPETILPLQMDPWGNEYILTTMAWHRKESGLDVFSMGGDGKRGGKGWKSDIILRIDLAEIRCEEWKEKGTVK